MKKMNVKTNHNATTNSLNVKQTKMYSCSSPSASPSSLYFKGKLKCSFLKMKFMFLMLFLCSTISSVYDKFIGGFVRYMFARNYDFQNENDVTSNMKNDNNMKNDLYVCDCEYECAFHLNRNPC